MRSLLLVGHGSPDERSAEALRELTTRVRERLAGVAVEIGFLETSTPTIADAAARLPRQQPVIVVPLLLATGYHTDVDLPRQLQELAQQVDVRGPLGPDPLLDAALVRRVEELPGPTLGRRVIRGSARHSAAELRRSVQAARQDGAAQVVIAAQLLAPGRFHDLLQTIGADAVTQPLAGTPELTELVLKRALPLSPHAHKADNHRARLAV